jgi:hypothetical protein
MRRRQTVVAGKRVASWLLTTTAAAAFMFASLLAAIPSAWADPNVGDPCIHADFNRTAVSADGATIRCQAVPGGGWAWGLDQGPQVDPAIAGQQAWGECIAVNTPAKCRQIVDGKPAPAVISGDGTYLVGRDIQPGTYRSAGGIAGGYSCVWFRHATVGGGAYDIINSGSSTGQQYVEILPSDATFETSFCQPWVQYQ